MVKKYSMIAGGNNNLIGISGKMGSGKDTVGSILQDYSDDNAEDYQIKKFASKLKEIVCLLIGCTRDQLENREFKEKELGEEWWYYCNSLFFDRETKIVSYSEADDTIKDNTSWYIVKLTPRKLLQLLGTEAGRNIIHPNIWINALFADYNAKGFDYKGSENKEIKGDWIYPNWIITDVRFPNEAKAIEDRGGIVIRVNRDSELEYKHTDKDALEMLTGMGYEDIDDDFSEEAINEGFRWSETLQKWSFDEDNFQEHPSETALDDYEFDHVIENDGSIEELVEKVKQLNLV